MQGCWQWRSLGNAMHTYSGELPAENPGTKNCWKKESLANRGGQSARPNEPRFTRVRFVRECRRSKGEIARHGRSRLPVPTTDCIRIQAEYVCMWQSSMDA